MRLFACDEHSGTPATVRVMEDKLRAEFNPTKIQVDDPHGDASSVAIFIVSDKFKGMLPLARHRAINALLKDEIKQIHAVTIDAKTPEQATR